jgi:hypothetical protein
VLEPLPAGAVYACPATPDVAGGAVVDVPLLCAKSYAIAPPRARVAMTFNVMNTIATRSFMGPLSVGRSAYVAYRAPETPSDEPFLHAPFLSVVKQPGI